MKSLLKSRGAIVPHFVEVDGQQIGTFDGEPIGIVETRQMDPKYIWYAWSIAYKAGVMDQDFMNMYPFLINKIPFVAGKGWIRCASI